MEAKDFALDLIDFLDRGSSSFQAVDVISRELEEKGYKELKGNEKWDLKEGDKAYYKKNGSSVFAFSIGCGGYGEGFKLIGSHSDSPSFRIKPDPEMWEEGFLKLNTEVYGGPILSTWFDRPLSMAGRVAIKSENPLKPELINVDFKKPILYIPNLAIHMNREVNKGVEIDRQKHILPILTLSDEKTDELMIKNLIAEECGRNAEDILDYDLFIYETQKGEIIGLKDEFISSKRMDNLAMAHASLRALTSCGEHTGINLTAVYDNEECGSSTKQGAGSPVLAELLERIVISMGGDREAFLRSLESSFLISADLAHAVHPNYKDQHDPTNRPHMGKGPVIKISANMKYTSDADSSSVFMSLCEKAGVPCQMFVNRSDKPGGSTIGPISSTQLPIRSVDIGNAILGMHSVREMGAVEDHLSTYKAFRVFFEI